MLVGRLGAVAVSFSDEQERGYQPWQNDFPHWDADGPLRLRVNKLIKLYSLSVARVGTAVYLLCSTAILLNFVVMWSVSLPERLWRVNSLEPSLSRSWLSPASYGSGIVAATSDWFTLHRFICWQEQFRNGIYGWPDANLVTAGNWTGPLSPSLIALPLTHLRPDSHTHIHTHTPSCDNNNG